MALDVGAGDVERFGICDFGEALGLSAGAFGLGLALGDEGGLELARGPLDVGRALGDDGGCWLADLADPGDFRISFAQPCRRTVNSQELSPCQRTWGEGGAFGIRAPASWEDRRLDNEESETLA